MANEPYGDVEVIIPPLERRQRQSKNPAGSSLTAIAGIRLRLRLHQDRRTLEIFRYTQAGSIHCNDAKSLRSEATAKSGGERSNPRVPSTTSAVQRVLPLMRAGYQVELVDEESERWLDESEKAGVTILREFLAICREAESARLKPAVVQDRRPASQSAVGDVITDTTVHRNPEAVVQGSMDVVGGAEGTLAVVTAESSLNAPWPSSASRESVRVSVQLPPRPERFRVPRSRASSSGILWRYVFLFFFIDGRRRWLS
jgi:hypothetical protein